MPQEQCKNRFLALSLLHNSVALPLCLYVYYFVGAVDPHSFFSDPDPAGFFFNAVADPAEENCNVTLS